MKGYNQTTDFAPFQSLELETDQQNQVKGGEGTIIVEDMIDV